MTTPSQTLISSSQIYPPAKTPEFWNMLLAAATPERDRNGNFILRRPLTVDERKAIQDRIIVLRPFIQAAPSDRRRIADLIVDLLSSGFATKMSTAKETAVVASQYIESVGSLPWWCVARACQRFRDGLVTADDLGVEHYDRAYAPSTAQLRTIAIEILRPFGEEVTRIEMTLRGSVLPIKTAEQHEAEKAAIAKSLEDFKRRNAQANLDEKERERDRNETSRAARREGQAQMRVQEYIDAGLEPPDASEGSMVSLAMMLKSGYSIEEVGGRNVLVSPRKAADLNDEMPEFETKPEWKTSARNAGDVFEKSGVLAKGRGT